MYKIVPYIDSNEQESITFRDIRYVNKSAEEITKANVFLAKKSAKTLVFKDDKYVGAYIEMKST